MTFSFNKVLCPVQFCSEQYGRTLTPQADSIAVLCAACHAQASKPGVHSMPNTRAVHAQDIWSTLQMYCQLACSCTQRVR